MTGDQRAMERANETVQKIMDERRVRFVYVRGDVLLNWFRNGITRPKTGFITFVDGIPENTLVLGVDYSLEIDGFKFLIGNLEFDPVPEGKNPMPLNITIRQFDDEKSNNSL